MPKSKVGNKKDKPQNKRYIAAKKHEKSHIKRIQKHLKEFPDDKSAETALELYKLKI